MESRKRPRVDDGDVLHSKKRVASDSRDSPVPVNGVSEVEEPKDGDSLEVHIHIDNPKIRQLKGL